MNKENISIQSTIAQPAGLTPEAYSEFLHFQEFQKIKAQTMQMHQNQISQKGQNEITKKSETLNQHQQPTDSATTQRVRNIQRRGGRGGRRGGYQGR